MAMGDSARTEIAHSEDEVSVTELAARIDRGQRPFLLDVRNRDEFDAWRIEARGGLATLNLPYFDILEQGGKDDVVDSVPVP